MVAVLERPAQVALEAVPQPSAVLDDERIVEVVLRADRRELLRGEFLSAAGEEDGGVPGAA
ncbi:hypothetical protein SSPO_025910 [Streptomyces antimycoticus]|uniref:Uncharacterized protein n=1 Tax=Streptomyces antimycoticus TaxID=68175 RepID=A0A499UF00_9ACTN|nr:hypothetical protein SSPO_025910 [Streptomyces antimycoticus]